MSLLDEAIIFAVKAHSGAVRKRGKTPYILHPLEALAIAGTMSNDEEILAAAVLHDTVEDTETTMEEIRSLFGVRVSELVASETEEKRPELPAEATWRIRKEESLNKLKNAEDPGVKILWLSDKLSNMRSFYRLKQKKGDSFWLNFNMKDPLLQAGYYRAVLDLTKELSTCEAWKEMKTLTDAVFKDVEENAGN